MLEASINRAFYSSFDVYLYMCKSILHPSVLFARLVQKEI